MTSDLHVLILEDRLADAELMLSELRRDGIRLHGTRVWTETDFLAQLRDSPPDLILSDYALPAYDGLSALQQARQLRPGIPFVLVSGSLGEELAVNALQQGATDYVLKQRLSRLGPAVRRALEERRLREEHQQAEEELRRAHAQLRQLLAHSPAVLYTLEVGPAQLIPKVVSENITLLLGCSPQDALQPGWFFERLHPEDRARVEAEIQTVLEGGAITPEFRQLLEPLLPQDRPRVEATFRDATERDAAATEFRIRHQNGSWRWVADRKRVLRDASGRPTEVVGVWTDVTERKRAERALAEERRLLRTILDNLPDLVFTKNLSAQVVLSNAAAAQFMGRSETGMAGKSVFDLNPPDLARGYHEDDLKVLREGVTVHNREEQIRDQAGRLRWHLTTKAPLRDPGGQIAGLVAICRDIDERKRAEEQLRKLARAVEQAPISIVITDRAGNIEFVNPKFSSLTGYTAEEALGQNPRLLKSGEMAPEHYRQLWETITAGGIWNGLFHNKRKDGTLFWESATISAVRDAAGAITHFVAVKEDLTERRLAEAKLVRAQRLESIGSLAGGIAHDLNNILTPILMCLPLLRSDLAAADREQVIATLEDSANRAVGVIKQLLSVGRGREGQKVPVQLRHLLRDMAKIARETFPRSIRIEEESAPDLWPVLGDPSQLHQVLLNLCVNARDAMPTGGRLRLSAENVALDEHFVSMHQEARPGPFVRIRVLDTGSGIPDSIRDRLFDPFFTTKKEGQGTGLGLTTVLGIVKAHGGFLHFTSTPGEGTTFEAHLPASPDAQALADRDQARLRPPRGQGELVMIVDDEPAIREAAQRTLVRQGYQVLTAVDGIDALAQFASRPGRIRVVVTDVGMPLMDGLTLCRTLRRLSPLTPILVSTGEVMGDRAQEIRQVLAELNVTRLLHKPHSADDLLSALHQALHEQPCS